jgi:hypothetical protein
MSRRSAHEVLVNIKSNCNDSEKEEKGKLEGLSAHLFSSFVPLRFRHSGGGITGVTRV